MTMNVIYNGMFKMKLNVTDLLYRIESTDEVNGFIMKIHGIFKIDK